MFVSLVNEIHIFIVTTLKLRIYSCYSSHILFNTVRKAAPLQPVSSFFAACGIWPEDAVNAHGIGMPRLVRIIEQRPDLYDELIIDRVIGLASYSAKGFQGSASCSSKKAIILLCVANKGQTADQIFTMENTHAIIPDLMGQTSPIKEGGKKGKLGLTTGVTLEELVNGFGCSLGRNVTQGKWWSTLVLRVFEGLKMFPCNYTRALDGEVML